MNRNSRAKMAEETVDILEHGYYTLPSGEMVNIEAPLHESVEATHYYSPDKLAELLETLSHNEESLSETVFEVVNETTLSGAKRLYDSEDCTSVGVLNFASAKHPGGGFLGGSLAQEESLAYASGLYVSQERQEAYYSYHKKRNRSALYSDRIIYTPNSPVFRDDEHALLEEPYSLNFISAPAPNAGSIIKNEPENVEKIEPTLKERLFKVLAVALDNRCDALVLGAWGCGVFQNNPDMVVTAFKEAFESDLFKGKFKRVTFSILGDEKDANIAAFQNFFA